jgi:hypothetical protein
VVIIIKLPYALTEDHAMKAYWGSGGIDPRIMTSALDGGEWLASRPCRFAPRERATTPAGNYYYYYYYYYFFFFFFFLRDV